MTFSKNKIRNATIVVLISFLVLIYILSLHKSIDKLETTTFTEKQVEVQLTKQRLKLSSYYEEKLSTIKKELIDSTPYKPTLTLSKGQNKLCLAIGVFGEERMGSEMDFVKIAQSVLLRTEHDWFGVSNACAALAYKSKSGTLAYSSMEPFLGDISDIVWGNINSFTPWLAKQNKADMQAWKRIVKITSDVVDGKYPQMTTGNHFVAMDKLKSVPGWLRAMRPVGVTSGHVLFIDHEIVDGQVVRYTKDNPYNQSSYNSRFWQNPENIADITELTLDDI